MVSETARSALTWTTVWKLPAVSNVYGRSSVVEAPASKPLIESDATTGPVELVLNWTRKPPAAHEPALETVMSTEAGRPATGDVGEKVTLGI